MKKYLRKIKEKQLRLPICDLIMIFDHNNLFALSAGVGHVKYPTLAFFIVL